MGNICAAFMQTRRQADDQTQGGVKIGESVRLHWDEILPGRHDQCIYQGRINGLVDGKGVLSHKQEIYQWKNNDSMYYKPETKKQHKIIAGYASVSQLGGSKQDHKSFPLRGEIMNIPCKMLIWMHTQYSTLLFKSMRFEVLLLQVILI